MNEKDLEAMGQAAVRAVVDAEIASTAPGVPPTKIDCVVYDEKDLAILKTRAALAGMILSVKPCFRCRVHRAHVDCFPGIRYSLDDDDEEIYCDLHASPGMADFSFAGAVRDALAVMAEKPPTPG